MNKSSSSPLTFVVIFVAFFSKKLRSNEYVLSAGLCDRYWVALFCSFFFLEKQKRCPCVNLKWMKCHTIQYVLLFIGWNTWLIFLFCCYLTKKTFHFHWVQWICVYSTFSFKSPQPYAHWNTFTQQQKPSIKIFVRKKEFDVVKSRDISTGSVV